MILTKYLEALVNASHQHRSWGFKVLIMFAGGLVFFVVLPAVAFLAAYSLQTRLMSGRSLQMVFAIIWLGSGILLVAWTVLTQITVGRGTPVPVAPPRRLIVTGPYRLCRNPIQLGAMIYYLGVGTLFGSMEIGLVMFLLGLVIGGSYHKFVEE
jgi:protein-S-isoprenylcysteine O-methyltransferase Ste14